MSPTVATAIPIDLTRIPKINKPFKRIGYRLEEEGDGFVQAVSEAVK